MYEGSFISFNDASKPVDTEYLSWLNVRTDLSSWSLQGAKLELSDSPFPKEKINLSLLSSKVADDLKFPTDMCFSIKITEALLVPQPLYESLIQKLNLAVCGTIETCKHENSDISQAPILKLTLSTYVETYYDYTDYVWIENGEVKYAIGVN